MGRQRRIDEPDAWHHVMNRAIARRSLFESEADIRFFLAAVARAIRRKEIEVHSWCVLTTHFHFLVRSPSGLISEAMQKIQNSYVRNFNRGRGRDGPLLRGRFTSRSVRSETYRMILVSYIDHNPIQAGLCETASDYVFGSARAYSKPRGPKWLSRQWVEGCLKSLRNPGPYDPNRYAEFFGPGTARAAYDLVEQRLRVLRQKRTAVEEEDQLDDLITWAPAHVRRWLQEKALLADGTPPGLPVASPIAVQVALEAIYKSDENLLLRASGRGRCPRKTLMIGLLRDLTASTFREIGERTDRSPKATERTFAEHRLLMKNHAQYAAVATRATFQVLQAYRRDG